MKNVFFRNTPIGEIGIAENGEAVTDLFFDKKDIKGDIKISETKLLKDAFKQIDEYFEGKRKRFDLPIFLEGTEFQKRVWNELTKIPYGMTSSYMEVAKKTGDKNSARAVGNANNKNPLPIIIPCHRVIGADGKTSGYAGGTDIKEYLLNLENKNGKSLREQLFDLSEEKYGKFSESLIPGTKNIIGVRMPALRKIAKEIARGASKEIARDASKEIAKGDWREFLKTSKNDYFEEIMIQGMVIGYANAEIAELLPFIKEYVEKIDNWALCDSFCNGLKITHKNPDLMWDFIKPYLNSDKEYFIRFGVVMMLCYYVKEEYLKRIFYTLDRIKLDGYYSKMAVAWLVSECFIKFPESTLIYLNCNKLDDFTYNKSLQKITESRKPDDDTKKFIKSIKR